MTQEIIIIAGPTASGKTASAIEIAKNIHNPIIINADAAQVYIENPIISAQPTEDEKKGIRHELYGYTLGQNGYSMRRWLDDIYQVVLRTSIEHSIIIVGGSGMYINAMLNGIANIPDISPQITEKLRTVLKEEGVERLYHMLQFYDKYAYDNLNERDVQRVMRALSVVLSTGKTIRYWQMLDAYHPFEKYKFKKYLKHIDREILYTKINMRFDHMMQNGALEEIDALRKMKLPSYLPILKSHGIPEIIDLIEGKISKKEAYDKAKQNVRNYAKRQLTWYKHQYPGAITI